MPDNKSSNQLFALHPNQIIRRSEGGKFFGLKESALDEAIKRQEIPAPFPLTPSGRATGWTGQQIMDFHRQRIEAGAARQLARRRS